jgi:uncharacterized protein YbaP (TraB family)
VVTGCSSINEAEKAVLARHPTQETRMTNQAVEGFQPAGVWRVHGVQNTVYLVGTAHVVPESQVPFPSPFYAAYHDSQIVYVEFDTDISFLAKVRLLPKVFRWVKANRDVLTVPKGKTLADYLPANTIDELSARYGRNFHRERMTPISLLFMREAGLLAATNAAFTGVEEPFMILARRDGKPLKALDDMAVVDTALLALDAMLPKMKREIAERGADAVVREALLGEEQDENSIWRRGDLTAVARVHEEIKGDTPDLYEKILPERNRAWMRKLEPVLRGKKNAMVLVGIAHMGGKDGLLDLVRASGFVPEQMHGVDRP